MHFPLVHLTADDQAFAASVATLATTASLRWISRGLTAALIFLPLGFFLGGFAAKGGDPGIGIFLVPVGAIALLTAVFGFVRRLFATSAPGLPTGKGGKQAG